MDHDGAGTPFVVRIASGDIAFAQATLLVVNQVNGLDPSGAEAPSTPPSGVGRAMTDRVLTVPSPGGAVMVVGRRAAD